jgi:hypothetical protein
MKKSLVVIFLIAGLAMVCGCDKLPDWLSQFNKQKPAQPVTPKAQGMTLASVNGRIITLEEFNEYINAYNSEIEASPNIPDSVKENYMLRSVDDKRPILQNMVERELLIDEAIDRGYNSEQEVIEAMEALKEQLLYAKIISEEQMGVNVTSREIEGYYNMYRDAFTIPEERRVSMIAVSSEEKAKEILIQLLQGAAFPIVARQNSIDQESAAKGGDIGFIVRQSPLPQEDKKVMFDKFEEIAFALELNEPSTIFKGPLGYYIIKITEIKDASQMMLSDVYENIEQGLLLKKQEETLENLVGNLRKAGNIVIYEELLR